jgi:DNA-binding response OmpR family regulator
MLRSRAVKSLSRIHNIDRTGKAAARLSVSHDGRLFKGGIAMQEPEQGAGQGASILIIEDDADTAEAMKVLLEGEGYRVRATADPEAGYAAIAETRPDLVVLDVMFGSRQKTQGFDYAVKIRQNREISYVPILMITAVNTRYPGFEFNAGADGEYLPVDDFIDKPAQPEDLRQKVAALLDQRVSKWRDWPRSE